MQLLRSILILSIVSILLPCCAFKSAWIAPQPAFAEISAGGASQTRVTELLGQADSVLFVDIDRERHTYRLDGIEGVEAVPAPGQGTEGVELAIDYCDGIVEHAVTTPIRLRWGRIGHPPSKVSSLPKDRAQWHAQLAQQITDEEQLDRGTGMWSLPGARFDSWLFVRDGDAFYLEPTMRFPQFGIDVFRSDADRSDPKTRKWYLTCERGFTYNRWDIELEFDPQFKMVSVTWHEPFKATQQGLLPNLIDLARHKATSAPLVTTGESIPWPRVRAEAERVAATRRSILQGQIAAVPATFAAK